MSLWWLTYNRRGRLHGVVVVEAASLISACVGVADNALDKGVSFVEGHELDAERTARMPPDYVGMMLSHKEAGQLLNRIERGDDKRQYSNYPPAEPGALSLEPLKAAIGVANAAPHM